MKPKKIALPRYRMNLSAGEMDEIFMQDIETHKRRSPYHFNDLRRRLIRTQHYPMPYLIKEKHCKEEYRAYAVINDKHQPWKEGIDFVSVVLFKNSRGTCVYTNLDPFGNIGERTKVYSHEAKFKASHRYLFTPHFFERYEMRHGWDGKYSDIYNQFFFNNLIDGACFYTQSCASRPDDYKTFDVWSLCSDGIMLGELKSEADFTEGRPYIIQLNTFLDLDTLTHRQDKYANILKSIKEAFPAMSFTESKADLNKRTFVTVVKNM